MTKRSRSLFYELFYIYKIHRFLLIQSGLILIAAGVIPWFEKSPVEHSITNFGQALWWAFSTVTSTGYGDFVPHTFVGRFIGVILMLSGLSLLSTAVALVASYFAYGRSKRYAIRVDRSLEEQQERLDRIEKKLDFLVRSGAEKDDKDHP